MFGRCRVTRWSMPGPAFRSINAAARSGSKPPAPGMAPYFWSAGRGWGVIDLKGSTVTLTVKGGELMVSRLRLPGRPGAATVEGRTAERKDDLILLGRDRTLQAGDHLVVRVDPYG